ncbi:MAG: amidohydrolase, partial [Megasphaera elsdenii]|nr:amidohydrolase [Megasphaera elsdenii]
MIDILETVRKDQGELVALRRHFHEHPELSKQEDQTLAYIAETLKGYGISYRIIDKGGLIAWIDGKGPGKTLLLRADV